MGYNHASIRYIGGEPIQGEPCFFTGSVHRNSLNAGYGGGACTSTRVDFIKRGGKGVEPEDKLRDGMTMIGTALSGDSGGAMMHNYMGHKKIVGITSNVYGNETYFVKTSNFFSRFNTTTPYNLILVR